jgi:hypothetical protein
MAGRIADIGVSIYKQFMKPLNAELTMPDNFYRITNLAIKKILKKLDEKGRLELDAFGATSPVHQAWINRLGDPATVAAELQEYTSVTDSAVIASCDGCWNKILALEIP